METIAAYSALRVDSDLAHEVAAAYVDGPSDDVGLLRASYDRLVSEADQLFVALTRSKRRSPIRVEFTTCATPYGTAQELITSVNRDGLLEVTVAADDCDRFHPMMDWTPGGAFDRFRAVHDYAWERFSVETMSWSLR